MLNTEKKPLNQITYLGKYLIDSNFRLPTISNVEPILLFGAGNLFWQKPTFYKNFFSTYFLFQPIYFDQAYQQSYQRSDLNHD